MGVTSETRVVPREEERRSLCGNEYKKPFSSAKTEKSKKLSIRSNFVYLEKEKFYVAYCDCWWKVDYYDNPISHG